MAVMPQLRKRNHDLFPNGVMQELSRSCPLGVVAMQMRLDPNVNAVSAGPLLGPALISGPLKADPVPVRVPERELSHSVGSYARRFNMYAISSQMFVSAIQFTAGKI